MELALVNSIADLEKFSCDACLRFLSVDPVKLYLDKKIRCGRCSKNYTGGIIISFGSVANQFFFKCVNRFDGCRKLLPSNLVEEHERNCLSKTYSCPVCPGKSCELPSYCLIPHFKQRHKRNISEKPNIFTPLNSDIEKSLLYNIEDHLFFITVKNSKKSVFLSALYVGSTEEAGKVIQKFVVTDTNVSGHNQQKNTKCKTCDCFGVSTPKGFSVDALEFKGTSMKISIELDLKELKSFRKPFSKMVDSNLDKIFLNPVFLNSNPQYSIDTTGTSLVIEKTCGSERIINFQCCICFDRLSTNYIDTVESDGKSLCVCCVGHYKAKEPNVEITKFFVREGLRNNLKFYCKWNCGELIPYRKENVEHDEVFCPFQPSIVCPAKYCVFEGDSNVLLNHFRKKHADANLYVHSTKIEVKESLNCEAKCLKKNSYFWMNNKFVQLKRLQQGDRIIFSIKYCSKEYANDNLQPAIIVYSDNKYSGTFKHNFVSKWLSNFIFKIILE